MEELGEGGGAAGSGAGLLGGSAADPGASGSLRQSSKVFIGGLSWETTGEKLRAYFENYGVVREAFVSYNRNNGRPRGFGFVVFESAEIADQVVATPHTIDRRKVRRRGAAAAAPRPPQPPDRARGVAARSRLGCIREKIARGGTGGDGAQRRRAAGPRVQMCGGGSQRAGCNLATTRVQLSTQAINASRPKCGAATDVRSLPAVCGSSRGEDIHKARCELETCRGRAGHEAPRMRRSAARGAADAGTGRGQRPEGGPALVIGSPPALPTRFPCQQR
eukprot:359359-Chlamydomonas_euryale.AAC.1